MTAKVNHKHMNSSDNCLMLRVCRSGMSLTNSNPGEMTSGKLACTMTAVYLYSSAHNYSVIIMAWFKLSGELLRREGDSGSAAHRLPG